MPPSIKKAMEEVPDWFTKYQNTILLGIVLVIGKTAFDAAYEQWLGMHGELKNIREELSSVQMQTSDVPDLKADLRKMTLKINEIEAKGILPNAEAQIRELKVEMKELRDSFDAKLTVVPAEVCQSLTVKIDESEARLVKLIEEIKRGERDVQP